MTQTLKLFNGTARKISIFSKEDVAEVQSSNRNLILKEGAIPLLEIETDSILNAKIETKPAPGLESNIPLVGGVTFSSVDPLPKGYDLYVVSNLYRSAAIELGAGSEKLATVFGVVYSADGKTPVGCTALAVG